MAVYLKYDDQVRIDSDPNKLICNQWDGLRNRYVVGSLKARSLIDVAFCQPLTFFTHHVTVTRPMIRSIMDCGEAWLLELEQLGRTGSKRPPALDAIAQRVLAQFPELRPGYDSWWAKKRKELEPAYLIATDAVGWEMPCAHLCDAAPYMLATHRRNLDEDAAGVPELEHAPKTTDKIESCFAVLDRTLVLGCETHALFGVASANLLKAFQSPEAKRKLAETTVKKRQRENGGTGGAAEVDELVAAWDMTSFNSLPREKRWGLIKDVRRKYKDLCVIAPRGARKAHAEAKVARLEKARAAELLRCMNRAAKHAEFSQIKPCTSTAELEALRDAHEDDNDYAKALRDQIRVRVHVFGFAQKRLPKIGGGGNLAEEAAELLRLEAELPEMVKTLLPVQVTAPQPYPVRAQHVAPPPLAVTMDQQYLVRVTTAWRELAAMTSQFIFRTPRARASRAVRAPRPQPRRTVSGRDEALSGTTFTEDEVNWKVLAPLWSAVDKQVVVWYYDVDAAAAASTTEEEMVVFASAVASGSKSPGPCPKPLERSTVMEIRSWVFNDTQT